MGIKISTKDFKVTLADELQQCYVMAVNALVNLECAGGTFFKGTPPAKEITVDGTVFANPTWISAETDLPYIKSVAKRYSGRSKHIIIGNGGSLEPAMAIAKALIHPTGRAELIPSSSPNPDDDANKMLCSSACQVGKDNTFAYAVSKSGETLNIILQALAFAHSGYEVVAITEDKPNPMRCIANELSLGKVTHTNVGGRFTANQPNALVPLYAAAMYSGLEKSIDDFVTGINAMAQLVRPDVPTSLNPAKLVALLLYKAELAGYGQIYCPIYSSKLMGAGALIAQLVHETYGKEGRGQTILAMEGPECQHHTNQRFFGGPHDMAAITVGVEEYEGEILADASRFQNTDIKGIGRLGGVQGLKFSDLLKYERLGVYLTAAANNIPVMDITLDRVDGDSLGKFFGLVQGTVMYSAFLRGYRWDDQPSVEESKNKTIKMALARQSQMECIKPDMMY